MLSTQHPILRHRNSHKMQLDPPPETDVGLVSYYLHCCVLGCGIPVDVPTNLLDYSNAHRLPQEHQADIFSVAIHVFHVEKVLNRIMFIDDHNLLLPKLSSNAFLSNEQAASFAHLFLPFANFSPAPGKIMICTPEWLQTFYLAPMSRYAHAMIERSHMLDPQPLLHLEPTSKRVEGQNFEKYQSYHRIQNVDVDIDDENDDCGEEVPLAVAIPIDGPRTSSQKYGVFMFLEGQTVKLSNLARKSLDGEIAIVEERTHNRLLVRIPGHPEQYSVKPENVVIVSDDTGVLTTNGCR